MTAEMYPDSQPPTPTEELMRRLRSVAPHGETARNNTMLNHFYGYCKANRLDPATTDPQDGPAIASGIHDFLSRAIINRIQKIAETSDYDGPTMVLAAPGRVERNLAHFYQKHGVQEPRDKVHQDRREAYMRDNLKEAWDRREHYPEVELTAQMESDLREQGDEVAADHALVLLAATGQSFRDIAKR